MVSVVAVGAAQTSTEWVPLHTPDGKPDLQGVWDFRTATPLERPREFADREFLSDQDLAAVERRAAERVRVQSPDDPLLNTAPWWLDFGTHVVSGRRSSLIIDPPDGRVPPMTPAGLKRQGDLLTARNVADGPEGLTPWDRCITRGLPEVMLPTAYNNNLQIVQSPGYVVIVTEMIHEARIVSTDGREHLPQSLRSWSGDSRGRWEESRWLSKPRTSPIRRIFVALETTSVLPSALYDSTRARSTTDSRWMIPRRGLHPGRSLFHSSQLPS
jgi:hypothetical protein